MPRNKQNKASGKQEKAPAGPAPYKEVVEKAAAVAEDTDAQPKATEVPKTETTATTADLPEESQKAAQSLLRRAEVALNLVKTSVTEYATNYASAASDGKLLAAIADDVDKASHSISDIFESFNIQHTGGKYFVESATAGVETTSELLTRALRRAQTYDEEHELSTRLVSHISTTASHAATSLAAFKEFMKATQDSVHKRLSGFRSKKADDLKEDEEKKEESADSTSTEPEGLKKSLLVVLKSAREAVNDLVIKLKLRIETEKAESGNANDSMIGKVRGTVHGSYETAISTLQTALQEMKVAAGRVADAPSTEVPIALAVESLALARSTLTTMFEFAKTNPVSESVKDAMSSAWTAVTDAVTTLRAHTSDLKGEVKNRIWSYGSSATDTAVSTVVSIDKRFNLLPKLEELATSAYTRATSVSDKALELGKRTGITSAVETVLQKAEAVDQSVTGGKGKGLIDYATNAAVNALDTAKSVVTAYKSKRATDSADVDSKKAE